MEKIVLGLSTTEKYKAQLKAFALNESTTPSGAFQLIMDHPEIYVQWLSELLATQSVKSAENV